MEIAVARLRADIVVRPSELDLVALYVDGPRDHMEIVERPGIVSVRGTGSTQPSVPLLLRFDVPPGCDIALRRTAGTVRIGDIGGRLTLDLEGAADVRAGQVGDVYLRLQGRGGRVVIDAVQANRFDVDIDGSGRLGARGDVEHLRARLTGSGVVDFRGVAQTADLRVDGSGYINLLRAERYLRRTCIGSGDTRVTHPPRYEIDAARRDRKCGRATPIHRAQRSLRS
jgi:hypothetical protein